MDDQGKRQNTDKRKRATRAERMARLESKLKELSAQEKRAKKAENWRDIRVMAYAMASTLQCAVTSDAVNKVVECAQTCLNTRDRQRLLAIMDRLGVSGGTLRQKAQQPLTLQDCGWCRSPVMRDGRAASGQDPSPTGTVGAGEHASLA